MRIINRIELHKFKQKHPQSRKPLSYWETVLDVTTYKDLNDLKITFDGKVDYLSSGYTVFDIGGNKYRLITKIDYLFFEVDVRIVWTHNEYSNSKNATDLRNGKI